MADDQPMLPMAKLDSTYLEELAMAINEVATKADLILNGPVKPDILALLVSERLGLRHVGKRRDKYSKRKRIDVNTIIAVWEATAEIAEYTQKKRTTDGK